MKEKTCIKRKHIFLGMSVAYPIGYVLYSWYHWAINSFYVEYIRVIYFGTTPKHTCTSYYGCLDCPTYVSTEFDNFMFTITIIVTSVILLMGFLIIFNSKFMNKCIVKKK